MKNEALEASIAHHERNVTLLNTMRDMARKVSYRSQDCALCSAYHNTDPISTGCGACPVGKATGKANCRETPYVIATNLNSDIHFALTRVLDAAKDEVNFLKSLREKKEEEIFYHAGQRFLLVEDRTEHLLVHTGGNQVCLVGMDSGNRWCEPTCVDNFARITQEEFRRIGGTAYTWKEVTKEKTN